ncbi:MAG: hypothetical protein Q9188_003722 [Gyalolechia gomerana]
MAITSSESLPLDPEVFGYLSNSLTPLHSPSTDYLVSTPQLQHPITTPQTRNWQPLRDPASSSIIPLNLSVPDPATPRSPSLRNDTPTPAELTPGSWRKRRRTGELVERPPKLRVNPPDSMISTSPEIQSSPEEEPASTADPESESGHSYVTPPEKPADPYVTASEVQHPSSSRSSASSTKAQPSRSELDNPLPPPPAAKVATHHNQLDGTADEHEPRRGLRPLGSCEKLRGSLKRIPAQLKDLFSKDKTSHGDGDDGASQEALKSSTQRRDKATWWSKTTERLRKRDAHGKRPATSKASQKSARNSLRHLFSSSRESSSDAHQVMNPFDNPAAPQAFGAPTHEEDTDSPVEPEPSSEEDKAKGGN